MSDFLFIQIAATTVAALLAVAGGVWLFRYQNRETEKQLARKLATRVAVELDMAALRDLIRSDVFEPHEVMWAMTLEGPSTPTTGRWGS